MRKLYLTIEIYGSGQYTYPHAAERNDVFVMRVSKALIEFENKIDTYFLDCEEKGTYPDEAGLILALGITKGSYEKYRDDTEGKYAGYARCIEEARLKRESIIVRGIYSTDTKSTTGKIFLARQPGNGGLSDKPKEDDKKVTIEVVISGESEHFD